MLDGFAIFVLGVAMPLIIAEFHFNPDVVGLIGASLVLGAVFGAGIGGPTADHLGRKPLMLADMIIICAGAATSALAKGPAMLFIGQLLVGVGIGIDFPVSSSYVSEVLPKRQSCAIDGRYDCVPVGRHVTRGCDHAGAAEKRGQRAELAASSSRAKASLPFYFFLLRLSAPDSPHWLLARGRFAEAAQAFHPDYA